MAAAFKKAAKSGQQREHRERAQPSSRKHLGILEKRKDYKLRANDYHKKQNALQALRRKAQEKNPDEFYFRMTRVQLQDGVHVIKQLEEETTLEQQKLMKTQDLKYIEMKRIAEVKKIERLKSELHLLEAEGKQPNKHTFFFDTKKEAFPAGDWGYKFFKCGFPFPVERFDIATHLNTVPQLVGRVYNRPTVQTLKKESIQGTTTPDQLQKLARQRKSQYNLLRQRIEREQKMFVIAQKLQTRKDLLDKTQKVKLTKETVNQPSIYKFQFKRKR